jgi:hypothetical protein
MLVTDTRVFVVWRVSDAAVSLPWRPYRSEWPAMPGTAEGKKNYFILYFIKKKSAGEKQKSHNNNPSPSPAPGA